VLFLLRIVNACNACVAMSISVIVQTVYATASVANNSAK
jgi:hypothetical protein